MENRITFYLLRHGEKEKIMGDPPLTQRGIKQTESTADFLKRYAITSIYASPLLRTKQTAQIIGKALGVEVIIDDRLKERMNWGDKPGETFDEFMQEWEKGSKNRTYKPTHGESAFLTGERFKEFLMEISDVSGTNVLVVTHGGTIGDFLLNEFTDLTLTSSPSGATYVNLDECSITSVELQDNMFVLKEVGGVTHLT
jgi:broad specificity phosphatase PhoE